MSFSITLHVEHSNQAIIDLMQGLGVISHPISTVSSMNTLKHPNNSGREPSIPLVRLALLQPFVEYLDQASIDTDQLLTENGLVRESLFNPRVFVPVVVINRFLEKGVEAAGDPFLGVHVGERLDLASWPPFVDAASHATSLSEFLIRFVRAAQDEASSARHYLEVGGSHARFKEVRTTPQDIPPAQNDGFTAAYTLRLLRRGAGNDWNPSKINVTVCEPAALPQNYLGTQIYKGDWMGMTISFPTEWLFKGVVARSLIKSSVSRRESLKVPVDFIDLFRQAVLLRIHDPELSLNRAAKLVGLSRQSLQRHLNIRGTTFTAEMTTAKKEQAISLLANTDKPVSEIATAVGFIDSTAFARAFKSWTGESPRKYRRNLK